MKRGGKQTRILSIAEKEFVVLDLLAANHMTAVDVVRVVKDKFNKVITPQYVYGIKCQFTRIPSSRRTNKEVFSDGLNGGPPRKFQRAVQIVSKLPGFVAVGSLADSVRFCEENSPNIAALLSAHRHDRTSGASKSTLLREIGRWRANIQLVAPPQALPCSYRFCNFEDSVSLQVKTRLPVQANPISRPQQHADACGVVGEEDQADAINDTDEKADEGQLPAVLGSDHFCNLVDAVSLQMRKTSPVEVHDPNISEKYVGGCNDDGDQDQIDEIADADRSADGKKLPENLWSDHFCNLDEAVRLHVDNGLHVAARLTTSYQGQAVRNNFGDASPEEMVVTWECDEHQGKGFSTMATTQSINHRNFKPRVQRCKSKTPLKKTFVKTSLHFTPSP